MAGAFFIPIGIMIHLYRPHGVLTAVSSISSGCILVWKKLFAMSIVANSFPFLQSMRISEMCGRERQSVMVLVLRRW
jgi:hypothetical protein